MLSVARPSPKELWRLPISPPLLPSMGHSEPTHVDLTGIRHSAFSQDKNRSSHIRKTFRPSPCSLAAIDKVVHNRVFCDAATYLSFQFFIRLGLAFVLAEMFPP